MAVAIKGAILGMACTYSQNDVTPFVKSLTSTGYTGAIHMGIDVARAEVAWFERHGISHHSEPCKEQDENNQKNAKREKGKIWLGNLNQRRWHYYKEWISLGQYDAIWLIDVRDVVFQAPPFAKMPQELELYVDKPILTDFQRAKIEPCLGAIVWQKMKASGMPNFCGGTVLGSAAGISALATGMSELVDEASRLTPKCQRNDQHLLNYYAYKHGIVQKGANQGRAMVYGRWEGMAVNAGTPCDEKNHFRDYMSCDFKTDSEACVLLNKDQAPMSIIHKWDRCKDLSAMVKSARDGLGLYKGYNPQAVVKYRAPSALQKAADAGRARPELTRPTPRSTPRPTSAPYLSKDKLSSSGDAPLADKPVRGEGRDRGRGGSLRAPQPRPAPGSASVAAAAAAPEDEVSPAAAAPEDEGTEEEDAAVASAPEGDKEAAASAPEGDKSSGDDSYSYGYYGFGYGPDSESAPEKEEGPVAEEGPETPPGAAPAGQDFKAGMAVLGFLFGGACCGGCCRRKGEQPQAAAPEPQPAKSRRGYVPVEAADDGEDERFDVVDPDRDPAGRVRIGRPATCEEIHVGQNVTLVGLPSGKAHLNGRTARVQRSDGQRAWILRMDETGSLVRVLDEHILVPDFLDITT